MKLIFFRTKIYYIRSKAQDSYQRSLKRSLKNPYDVFNEMSKEFFFPKVILWEQYSNDFFLHTKKKSVSVLGIFGRTKQKCFQCGQRPSYMILWKQGNFCESKLLWANNGLKFNFELFFCLRQSRLKVDRNWLLIR